MDTDRNQSSSPDIKWFYVENNNKLGPIDDKDFFDLISSKKITRETYVWRKGFSTWTKAKDVAEIIGAITESEQFDLNEETISNFSIDPSNNNSNESSDEGNENEKEEEEHNEEDNIKNSFDWMKVNKEEKIFFIKQKLDCSIYGPFSLLMIKTLYEQKRINGKSLIFTPSLSDFQFLAEIPIYQQLFLESPPDVDLSEKERRQNIRRPFVAKMFFHDNKTLYEGICRDISTGGMQVLLSDFPANKGDELLLNVHPENNEYHFLAKGKVARVLDGNQGIFLRFTDLSSEAKETISSYIQNFED